MTSCSRETPFPNINLSWNEQKFGHGSRPGPKPKTTVMARTSRNLLNWIGVPFMNEAVSPRWWRLHIRRVVVWQDTFKAGRVPPSVIQHHAPLWISTDISEEHLLHVQGFRISQARYQLESRWQAELCSAYSSTLKITLFITTAERSSNTAINSCFTTGSDEPRV
jgi:hypothetical protein